MPSGICAWCSKAFGLHLEGGVEVEDGLAALDRLGPGGWRRSGRRGCSPRRRRWACWHRLGAGSRVEAVHPRSTATVCLAADKACPSPVRQTRIAIRDPGSGPETGPPRSSPAPAVPAAHPVPCSLVSPVSRCGKANKPVPAGQPSDPHPTAATPSRPPLQREEHEKLSNPHTEAALAPPWQGRAGSGVRRDQAMPESIQPLG